MVDGTVNTCLLPSFDGHPQHWTVLDIPEQTLLFLHQHAGTAMAMKELKLASMPLKQLNTVDMS
jgi:hypothetical protein